MAFIGHVGDFKGGDITLCTDEYFNAVKTEYFDKFESPMVYTPGDNDWTDCYRTEDGNYNPIERLQKVREIFFSDPGLTTGAMNPKRVISQASFSPYEEYKENLMWTFEGVVAGTFHTVGSNNGRVAWDELPGGDLPEERVDEYLEREEAAIAWIKYIFKRAIQTRANGVVLITQAGMWPAYELATGEALNGFDRICQTLARESNKFDKPVWLINGDQHDYVRLTPFTKGATHPQTGLYGEANMSIYRIHGEEFDAPKFTAFTLETYQIYDADKPGYDPNVIFEWFELKVRPSLGDNIFAYQRHKIRNETN